MILSSGDAGSSSEKDHMNNSRSAIIASMNCVAKSSGSPVSSWMKLPAISDFKVSNSSGLFCRQS